MDEIEFPQADPAIQYIARQVAMIQDQYACNAGYHRDHKELRQRFDKLDSIISELNMQVKNLDIKALNEIQGQILQSSNSYLEETRKINAAGLSDIKKASQTLQSEISDKNDATMLKQLSLVKGEMFQGLTRIENAMTTNAISWTSQITRTAIIAVIVFFFGLMVGMWYL